MRSLTLEISNMETAFFQADFPPYTNIKPQDNHIQSSTVR